MQTDAADPRRIRPAGTIVDLGQRQQTTALGRRPWSTSRGAAVRRCQNRSGKSIGGRCHGEPHWFTTLSQRWDRLGIPNVSQAFRSVV